MPKSFQKGTSWPALMTLVVGLSLSFLAYTVILNNQKIRTESDLHKFSVERSLLIESNLQTRLQMLRSIQTFYAASHEVSESEFAIFAHNIQKGYPSFAELGWAPKGNDDSLPVTYVVGEPNFFFSTGYDLNSTPSLKENISKAIDMGKIISIPYPVELANHDASLVLFFVPIYKNSLPAETVEQRRDNFLGFVFAVNNIARTIDKALLIYNEHPVGLEIALYHGKTPDDAHLIYYRLSPVSQKKESRVTPREAAYLKSFLLAENTWTVATYPTPYFFQLHRSYLHWLVLALGGIISVLAFGYVNLFFRRQREIEVLVRQKLVQLEEHIKKIAKMQAIDQFVTGMVHEFNNPLSVVCSNAQLLIGKIESLSLPNQVKDEIQGELSLIQTHARRCSDIAARFFSLSRQDTTEQESLTDINECVRTVTGLLDKQFKEAKIIPRFELNPLPPLFLGQTQMEQVLMNLMINAIHAMPDGGELTIKSSLNFLQEVVLQIVDTGTGISPGDLPRVFEPFFTTKPSGRGVGLGLAVCQSIIKNFGGDIVINSVEGKGTSVTLTLSLERENI